jgi:hypothetical protein
MNSAVRSIVSAYAQRPCRRLLGIAILSLLFTGCGGLPATVEGVVTLDGKPLPNGRIWFHPDSPGPMAYGVSLQDGSYRLKTGAKQNGLLPGRYRVTVYAMDVADSRNADGTRLTPAVYGEPSQTPLRAEVAKGSNRIPLILESSATASDERASR